MSRLASAFLLVISLGLDLYGATTGFVDYKNCTSVGGWVADKATLNLSVNVFMYRVGTSDSISNVANGPRGDVGEFLHDNGLHGFVLPVPETWKRGAIDVEVRGSDGKVLGGGKFTLNCVADPPPDPDPDPTTPTPAPTSIIPGTGILIVCVPSKPCQILVDGSTVPMWANPQSTPCPPRTLGMDAEYLYVCFLDGEWRKLRWVK